MHNANILFLNFKLFQTSNTRWSYQINSPYQKSVILYTYFNLLKNMLGKLNPFGLFLFCYIIRLTTNFYHLEWFPPIELWKKKKLIYVQIDLPPLKRPNQIPYICNTYHKYIQFIGNFPLPRKANKIHFTSFSLNVLLLRLYFMTFTNEKK